MSLNLDKSVWARTALRKVAAASKEKVDPTSGDVDRYIAGEHMASDDLKILRWGEVGDGYLGPAFHRRFHSGQILYGSRRTYLRKVAVAEFDGVTANTTFVVETKDPSVLLQEFLPFVMTAEPFHKFAILESRGSVNPYVNWSDIERYEFDLPPLDEQKRLADLLWAIEAHRSTQAEIVEGVSRLSTTVLASVGKHSPVVSLSSWVARIEAGRSPQAASDPASETEFGVLKVSAVGRDIFVARENKRLLNPAAFRPADAVLAGDVLVTRANAVVDNVARPCMVDRDYPNLMLSDKTLRLVPAPGYPSRLVLAALQAPEYRAHVRGVVSGTEAKNISQARILAGPVPDLGPGEVQHVLDRLVSVDRATAAGAWELSELIALKSSFLADIFGETDGSVQ